MSPKEERFIKIEALFVDEMSGLVIVRMLHKKVQSTFMLKIQFVRNSDTLDVLNRCLETVIFKIKEMLGILDLRSIGYYKIKHGVLQPNLSKYFTFESG